MGNFCSKCGNKIENNENFCLNCGNKSNENNQIIKKKVGYGKCLGFTILGAIGIFLLGWIISFIVKFAGIEANISFIMIMLPILAIVFSPIIALIIYLIKNK